MSRHAPLLVLVLVLATLVPSAIAHDAITVGSAGHQVLASVGSDTEPDGLAGESKTGTGLTFTDSATGVSNCGSANASQNAATDNAGESFTITYTGDVSASYGSVVNCSPTQNRAEGRSIFGRNFSVSTPVAYTIEASRSGSVNAGGSHAASVSLSSTGGGSGQPGFVIGAPGAPCCSESKTVSGVLGPGSYILQADTLCVANINGTCSGHSDVSLLIGEAAPAVFITAGPSGVTSAKTAHFEFDTATPDPPPGVFQCKVDGQASFTTCSSPQDLANLSDGSHTFSVRYDPDGSTPPSGPAVRTWTIDTTGPAVVFDSAPSGTENPSDATITWHASEGSSFRCQLDGGTAFDCSSPHTLLGLAPGPHSFSVSAIDGAGNESVPTTASWSVGAGAPVSVACANGATAGFGPIRLVARAENACFADDTIDGTRVQVSTGVVSMNGITLTPASGTRIIVAETLGDGTVRTDGPVTVIFGPPPRAGENPIDFSISRLDLDNLRSAATGIDKILNLGAGILEMVPNLKVLPEVRFKFGPENGGQTVVTTKVTLPAKAFSSLRDRPEKVTLTFAPTLSNDKGITVAGRVKGSNFFLFGQKVKGLDLGYDFGSGVFDGLVSMEVGSAGAVFTGGLAIGPADERCQLRKLSLAASELKRPVGAGVMLQRFGGAFECLVADGQPSVRLTASGGVSLGPRISIGGFNAEALSIDGTASLTLPVDLQRPFKVAISGVGKVVDLPVSQQTVTYTSPATIKLTGALDVTGGGFGARLSYGEGGTFVSPNAFNIEAEGTASLFGVARGASGVFSSNGFAVCIGAPGAQTGFGRAWGGELTAFTVCDLGPFRATASARAAQTPVKRFTIRRGTRVAVVAVTGTGGAPEVTLAGPGGRAVPRRDLLLARDAATNRTYAVITDPAPGTWTATTAGTLKVALGLPPVSLRASVRRAGARRVLRWRAPGLRGQRLEFVERAAGGGARRLSTTRRSSGTLRFTPAAALGAQRRTIEAIAYNRATPRSSTTVARFVASAPAKPTRVRDLKLSGRTLRWRAQRGIPAYELGVTLPDGTTLALRARRNRITIAGLPSRGAVRVAIVALDALGASGPVVRAKVR